MNKARLLETVVIAGALTGLLLWFLFGSSMKSARELSLSRDEQTDNLSKKVSPAKEFTTLEKSEKMPAEVNDVTVKELDSYVMGVDSTGTEDLSDLE